MRSQKALLLVLPLIALSLLSTVLTSAVAQVPTYKLGVKTGDWATYEASDVVGEAVLNFSSGDRVKFVVKDKGIETMKHPDGTVAFYREAAYCDVYADGKLIDENSTFGWFIFYPNEEGFWEELEDLAAEWEAAAPPGVEAEWDVEIGSWFVDIYIYNKSSIEGYTFKIELEARVDKDTGVATRVSLDMEFLIFKVAFTLTLKETNVAGVGMPYWPPFIPSPEQWGWAPDWLRDFVANYWWPYLLIGSVVVIILIIAGIVKLITRRRRPAYPYYPPPPPRYPPPPSSY